MPSWCQSRAEQSRAEQSRAEQSRIPSHANIAETDGTPPEVTEQSNPGPEPSMDSTHIIDRNSSTGTE
ncbi:hypothetical protein L1887_03182 [Cichorium endivia]|nr:hypothetical protein L1887_03182 [Cichorium endivia]